MEEKKIVDQLKNVCDSQMKCCACSFVLDEKLHDCVKIHEFMFLLFRAIYELKKKQTQKLIRKTVKKSFLINFARLTLRIENDLSSRLYSCSVVVFYCSKNNVVHVLRMQFVYCFYFSIKDCLFFRITLLNDYDGGFGDYMFL